MAPPPPRPPRTARPCGLAPAARCRCVVALLLLPAAACCLPAWPSCLHGPPACLRALLAPYRLLAEADSALWGGMWEKWGTCADGFGSQLEYFQYLLTAAKQYDVNVRRYCHRARGRAAAAGRAGGSIVPPTVLPPCPLPDAAAAADPRLCSPHLLPFPALPHPQKAVAGLASQCSGEIAKSDLLSQLKKKVGADVWLTCDPK